MDVELERRIGRDEMNLAEYPLTLLADRVDTGVKTIVFKGAKGQLTIAGSDDYGLPTAADADVIVALIQLTHRANDFTDPTVQFVRGDVLEILGWPDDGRHYRRLTESLQRWVGVTLRWDGSWYDNKVKSKVDAAFHIIESVVIYDAEVRRKVRARGQEPPLASFTWNKVFFASCQSNYLKKLDVTTYFGLRSAISKQALRFLDKRFFHSNAWTFDLREFANEHVGLSRNYTAAKLKQKLRPALEELEAAGFLEPLKPAERYTQVGRGQWKINLVRRKVPVEVLPAPVIASTPAATPELPLFPAEVPDVGPVAELVDRGVTRAAAIKLAEAHDPQYIAEKIELFDWLMAKRSPGLKKNPAGWLAASLANDFAPPPGYVTKQKREKQAAADQARRDQEDAERQERARDRDEAAKLATYWAGLTPEEKARIDADALAVADPEMRQEFEGASRAVKPLILNGIRDEYLKAILKGSSAAA